MTRPGAFPPSQEQRYQRARDADAQNEAFDTGQSEATYLFKQAYGRTEAAHDDALAALQGHSGGGHGRHANPKGGQEPLLPDADDETPT